MIPSTEEIYRMVSKKSAKRFLNEIEEEFLKHSIDFLEEFLNEVLDEPLGTPMEGFLNESLETSRKVFWKNL